jgi:gamma-glutamylcyclotransferase (GGCT)/AIG2-like uncharacterized protein YtfP
MYFLAIQFTLDIAGFGVAIMTMITLFYLSRQISQQGKRDKTDLTLSLYKDFFSNSKFLEIFSNLDYDNMKDAETNAKKIIENHPENKKYDKELLSEQEISYYLNYFNTIGHLIKNKIVSDKDIREIFNYQIEKTFSNFEIIKYAEEGKFKHIESLNIKNKICFFFYGTLMNKEDRIKHIGYWKTSFEKQARLSNYCMSDLTYKNDIFPAIIDNNKSVVDGVCIEFICDYNETLNLFKNLDSYEMEGVLYKREWVEVVLNSSEKKSCWSYVKI